MRTGDNKENNFCEECLGKAAELSGLVKYADGSIVSRTLIDKSKGTITLFAFDKSQKLSEHQSPYDAVVYVLEGSASITIAKEVENVQAGNLIIMPANIPHSVKAPERFKMMLIMIRS